MKSLLATFATTIIFVTHLRAETAPLSSGPPPFKPGEKLVYRLSWGCVPAGTAVFEVLPIETLNGVPSYHFVMTARTNRVVDAIYKVRDRIDGFATLPMTRSLLYRKKQEEGRHKRDIEVTFDWQQKVTQYSNRGKKSNPVALKAGTFDPLSSFYAFRCHDIDGRESVHLPVTDGKRSIDGQVRIIKKERVKTPLGTYTAHLVEPEMNDVGGVFKKRKNARVRIWFSDDAGRIPVKFSSKVAVGSFYGELIGAENVASERAKKLARRTEAVTPGTTNERR